nr:retrovirus-related Pol polyprotein from transposon TNT 1-94 [Tanacetum cinerariifolium]
MTYPPLRLEENVVSKTNQEPPQDSDIRQLIEECSVEVPVEQKQKMDDTMFDLVKICHHKQFLCIHDDVDNLIESALDSKLLSINSQHPDKKEHEVTNVAEQPAERRNQSNAENLLPILSKCEVTLEDEIKCDMPAKYVCSPVFTTFSNPLFKDDENFDYSDDKSLPDKDVPAEEFKIYSNHLFDEDKIKSDKLDPHFFNVESDFVESLLNRDTFIDFSSKFDFSGELAHIKPEIPKSDFYFEEEIRLIENLLYDNSFPRPPKELNTKIADTIIESIPLLPIPVQDGEADLFLSDDSIPSGIENFADEPEGDIHFLEGLLINDSILSHESSDSNFEDSPLIPRPPQEPPNDNFDLEPEVISAVMEDIDEPDEHFNPGGEIFVSTNIEDVDYFPFMFVIRIFLPYLIILEIFPLLLSAESEDTIFDPVFILHQRPRHRDVIWKKKGSSNTSNVGLSDVIVSNLNKNVKRYSRKDLLACNNSHLGETRSDYVYNDAMNVSCDSRINDLLDDNNFFIFDDVNVKISPVSKIPFRKKPRDSMHVRSKSNMIKSLPRTVYKWLPKWQSLAEPVAKWFPRIVQICLWIIDSGCSNHMTGNHVLLTNFVEKFLGTVRFGNNDFAVIAGYGEE